MRILVVHSEYRNGVNSGENLAVEKQVDALRQAGNVVHLFTSRTVDQPIWSPVTAAWRVASGYGHNPTEILKRERPDIVHIHNLFPNISTRWLAHIDKPLVVTLHNFRPFCAAATFHRDGKECTLCPDLSSSFPAIKHACYRDNRIATLPLAVATRKGGQRSPLLARADVIVSPSRRAAELIQEKSRQQLKIRVVPNFSEARQSPAVKRGAVFVGRLVEEKGILDLLDSWPQGTTLSIIGDGPLREIVSRRCERMPQVDMYGSMEHNRVLQHISNARMLVIPSTWAEGLPTVYIEAVMAKTAVIARVGSSAADAVDQDGTGISYSTTAQLRAAINSSNSRNVIRNFDAPALYSRAQWLKDITDVYREAINGS